MNKCTTMNVTGVVSRGALRKTWRSCVKRDMNAMDIKEEITQDRCAWRNITGGPTRASADALHMMMMNSSIFNSRVLPLEFCSYVVCVHAEILSLLTLCKPPS